MVQKANSWDPTDVTLVGITIDSKPVLMKVLFGKYVMVVGMDTDFKERFIPNSDKPNVVMLVGITNDRIEVS